MEIRSRATQILSFRTLFIHNVQRNQITFCTKEIAVNQLEIKRGGKLPNWLQQWCPVWIKTLHSHLIFLGKQGSFSRINLYLGILLKCSYFFPQPFSSIFTICMIYPSFPIWLIFARLGFFSANFPFCRKALMVGFDIFAC